MSQIDHAKRLREMAAGLPLRGRTRSIPEHWASMLAVAWVDEQEGKP